MKTDGVYIHTSGLAFSKEAFYVNSSIEIELQEHGWKRITGIPLLWTHPTLEIYPNVMTLDVAIGIHSVMQNEVGPNAFINAHSYN